MESKKSADISQLDFIESNTSERLKIGTLKVISGVANSGKTTESINSALNNGGRDILIVTDEVNIYAIIDRFEDRVLKHSGEIIVMDSDYYIKHDYRSKDFNTVVLDMVGGLENLKHHISKHYTPHYIITEQINRSDDNIEMKIIEYRW